MSRASLPRPRRARRSAVAALVVPLVVTLGLAACSDDGGGEDADPDELADRLTTARGLIDDAASLDFTLETDALPDGVDGLVSAEGVGTHDPAFEGRVEASAAGIGTGADVIAVDDVVHVRLDLLPVWREQDVVETYGAPDPAALMSTETGVSSLLTETDDLALGDQQRDGDDVFSTIDGTVSGEIMQRVIPSADTEADFDVSYRLDDEDDSLTSATVTGPFYPGDTDDDVTYTLTLDASDESVDITAP